MIAREGNARYPLLPILPMHNSPHNIPPLHVYASAGNKQIRSAITIRMCNPIFLKITKSPVHFAVMVALGCKLIPEIKNLRKILYLLSKPHFLKISVKFAYDIIPTILKHKFLAFFHNLF